MGELGQELERDKSTVGFTNPKGNEVANQNEAPQLTDEVITALGVTHLGKVFATAEALNLKLSEIPPYQLMGAFRVSLEEGLQTNRSGHSDEARSKNVDNRIVRLLRGQEEAGVDYRFWVSRRSTAIASGVQSNLTGSTKSI